MEIFYQDGTPVPQIEYKNLNLVYQMVRRDGSRLSAGLLTEDTGFAILFMYWFKACIDYMWYADHGKKPEFQNAPEEEYLRILPLFREDAQEDACREFLEKYSRMLTTPHYPNIGDRDRAQEICREINARLSDTAPYLRLRTAAACLLAGCFPEELFSEGEGWPGVLGGAAAAARFEEDLLAVEDGAVFLLDFHVDFSSGQRLIPRTLCNKSEKMCSFTVLFAGEQFFVELAPYGILRAVFSDPACTKLAGLKGCISCGDTKRAVIQKGTKDGVQLLFAGARYRKPLAYPQAGVILDACAAELGGAVILGAGELYSTVDSGLCLQKKDGLPIRCFRSGYQWARLYADGRLESSLGQMEGISAVVEDAERGLLVCGKDGAADYRSNCAKPVSEEAFGKIMLSRFPQTGDCEVQETQIMKLTVRASGKVEVL
ncbi:MAG: hypothetical protein K2O18_01395 [Oscillospiraceae bacterium]|nr:hypothetical protein [Oscillospiraceae bacterium]